MQRCSRWWPIAVLAHGSLDTRAPRLATDPPRERRDNFVSIASHELRTPLSIILNYAHFLGTVAPLEGEAAVALGRIEEAGRVQADLLDHLLAADALQSNRYPPSG